MFTTPLIRALRREYPDACLTYVVEPAAAPLVEHNRHLDEVIVAPKTRGLRRLADDLSLARRLRRTGFDLAIDLHGGPRSAWLARGRAAPASASATTSKDRAWMCTRVVHRARDLRPRHSVANQWDLLEAIPGWRGGQPTPAADPVEMVLDAAADDRMARRLRDAGVLDAHQLIVVHVSAGQSVSPLAGDLLRRSGRSAWRPATSDDGSCSVPGRPIGMPRCGSPPPPGNNWLRRPAESWISESSTCRSSGR